MGLKHFVYSVESSLNTWTTPAKWLWVNSAQVTSKRESLPIRTTGVGRDVQQYVLGAKPVNGPIVTPWWFTNIAPILKTFLQGGAAPASVATGVYDHAMLYDDAVLFDSLSLQEQYNTNFGLNVLGAVVNGITINASTKQQVTLNLDIVAKDEAQCGEDWESGTASEALIATPAYPTMNRGFMFYDATITLGGTVALGESTKKLTVSAGTETINLRNLSIAIKHNIDTDAYGLTMDPTLIAQDPGAREFDVQFQMPWSEYDDTFYQAARAGTAMSLEAVFQGPLIDTTYHYEAHICLPALVVNPDMLPALDGESKAPQISIKCGAQQEATTGVSFGLWVRSSEATL
jgi:hypothetical protein